MTRTPRWISQSAVLALQEWLLALHGGASGVRDAGLLESALASPRNRFEYGESDLCALAAAYAFALTRNHPFVDGNKRIAFAVAGLFLEHNGVPVHASEAETVHAMRALAAGRLTEVEFAAWLRKDTLSAVPSKKERTKPVPRKPATRKHK